MSRSIVLRLVLLVALGPQTAGCRDRTSPVVARQSVHAEPQVEVLGPAPSSRLQFDPETPRRVFAGGAVSSDGGRSWTALAERDGARMELLGGPTAVPIAVGVGGRVLCGETIFTGAGI